LNKKTKQSTNQNKNVAGIIAAKAFRPQERQTTATFANDMGAG
jgi:hypothetical protein